MRRASALLAALMVLGGCGHGPAATQPTSTSSASTPVSTTTAPSTTGSSTPARFTRDRCADLVVLGLRGQGQPTQADHGVGHEVLVAARSLVSHLPGGRTVRLQPVRYPAGSNATYDADVATGVRLVTAARSRLASACPRTRLAVIGFSEGAQVAHLAAARTPFALAVLIGDPLRNPSLGVRTLSFRARLTGRGNAGLGPAFAAPAGVLEVCAAGDNVCNAPLSGRVGAVSATHHTFYERAATARVVGRTAVALMRSNRALV